MFISRIKEIRIAHGWSQKELAKRSHLSQTQISNIELGHTSTTLDTLEAICNAFGDVCIYDIFFYECDKYKACQRFGKSRLNCYEKCCRFDKAGMDKNNKP